MLLQDKLSHVLALIYVYTLKNNSLQATADSRTFFACIVVVEDDDDFNVIQPTLLQQLKTILDQYPDDGQILKVIFM